MSKKIRITTALLLLLLAGLSACQRPYSKAPVATPQVIDSASTPLPVDQQILNATMTAQAIMEKFNQPTVMVTNAQGTPVVATPAGILLPTNTPVPNPTRAAAHACDDPPADAYRAVRRDDLLPGAALRRGPRRYAGAEQLQQLAQYR